HRAAGIATATEAEVRASIHWASWSAVARACDDVLGSLPPAAAVERRLVGEVREILHQFGLDPFAGWSFGGTPLPPLALPIVAWAGSASLADSQPAFCFQNLPPLPAAIREGHLPWQARTDTSPLWDIPEGPTPRAWALPTWS